MPRVAAFLFVLLILPLSGVDAQPTCSNYGPHPNAVAWLGDLYQGSCIARVGGYAYVGDNLGNVKVVDTRDPAHPVVVETLLADDPDAYRVADLVAGGGRLYARVSRGGQLDAMDVFDLSDPGSPVHLETQLPPGMNRDLFTASGDLVAYASAGTEVSVLDVQDPSHPQSLGSLTLPGGVRGMDSQGDRVYVTVGTSYNAPVRALIVIVVDPVPRILAQVDLDENPGTVSVDGSYVYITSSDLLVVDLSDTGNPVVHAVPAPRLTRFLAAGGRGYGVGPGLWFYNLSNPVRPRLTGNTQLPLADGFSSTSGILESHDVVIQDGYVFVVRLGGGLSVYDIEDRDSPIDWTEAAFPQSQAIVQNGQTAFAGNGNELQAFSLAEPGAPRLLGSLDLGLGIRALALDGSRVLAGVTASGQGKLVILNVADPAAPEVIDQIPLPDWIWVKDILPYGGMIYLTGVKSYEAVLGIVDASTGTPQLQAVTHLEGYNTYEGTTWEGPRLAADGQYLGITSYNGFRLMQLDPPSPPEPVAQWTEAGHLSGDMVIHGSKIFLTLNTRREWYNGPGLTEGLAPGLRVIDISNPAEPKETGRVTTMNGANDLVVSNGLAYVQVTTCGIHLIDVADPGGPREVGYWLTPDDSRFTVVDGSIYAYPKEESGVLVSPPACEEVVPVRLLAFDARWSEDRAVVTWHVAEDDPGTRFRLTAGSGDGDRLVPYTRVKAGMFRAEDLLAGGTGVAYTLDVQERDGTWTNLGRRTVVPGVTPPRPLAVYPNPFRAATTIRYRTETTGPVIINIFDASGRQVRHLVDRVQVQGEHTADWDGRDDRTRHVASGVYYLRLRTPRRTQRIKLVVRAG